MSVAHLIQSFRSILSLIVLVLFCTVASRGVYAREGQSPSATIDQKLSAVLSTDALTSTPILVDTPLSFTRDRVSYALVDLDTNAILMEQHGTKATPIASITKIMTAVVALDLMHPDTVLTVSKSAEAQIPTKIGIKQGERFTLEELLHALLLTSANDAAAVIAEGIDNHYGQGTFLYAMNKKAALLGMAHTHFDNPQGFDSPENFSSPIDIATLSNLALSTYPLLASIAQKEYAQLSKTNTHRQFDLYNWNGLLGVYPTATGLKIGNTELAGKTTVVTAHRDGKKLMAIILGAPTVYERDLWAAELLDVGYDALTHAPPVALSRDQLSIKYASWTRATP